MQIEYEFQSVKNRPQHSSRFEFRKEGKLLSYIQKNRQNVIFVSSLHNDEENDLESGDEKSTTITFYNSTKSAVDAINQMVEASSVA